MKLRKNFIYGIFFIMICLLYLTFTNLTTFVGAEAIETMNNFDIKNLSGYINSKDYVVCYIYKGQDKGNYIVYPYLNVTAQKNGFLPFFYENHYYLYNVKENTFTSETVVYIGYDWRKHDSYIIGSTYDIKSTSTDEVVFFKTLSNDNIMYTDITSGTIYNNFFSVFKSVIIVVLVFLVVIVAFYKCWGWLRETIQGI